MFVTLGAQASGSGGRALTAHTCMELYCTWLVAKIRVPCWVLNITRHLVFGGSKRDHNFDNHPHGMMSLLCFNHLLVKAPLPRHWALNCNDLAVVEINRNIRVYRS